MSALAGGDTVCHFFFFFLTLPPPPHPHPPVPHLYIFNPTQGASFLLPFLGNSKSWTAAFALTYVSRVAPSPPPHPPPAAPSVLSPPIKWHAEAAVAGVIKAWLCS